MEMKEFFKEKIDQLVSIFTNAKVSYEYDQLDGTHFIEVLPQDIYDSDEFLDWECETFKEFISAYPCENICFISEDASVTIENIEYAKEGIDYIKPLCLSFHINDSENRSWTSDYHDDFEDSNNWLLLAA